MPLHPTPRATFAKKITCLNTYQKFPGYEPGKAGADG